VIDVLVKVLGIVAEAEPLVEDFFRQAVARNPDHPLSRRVEQVLPVRGKSREAFEQLGGGGNG